MTSYDLLTKHARAYKCEIDNGRTFCWNLHIKYHNAEKHIFSNGNIPKDINNGSVRSNFRDYLTSQFSCRFAFHSIDNTETLRIIKNIKTSHSRVHDGISSELLKLIAGDISKCITLIINQYLHSGISPDKLKIAKVTPIHTKKGDSKLITNYRPISVLSAISKFFETVICDQLNHYFV